MKYLVWIEVGGEQGSWECRQEEYNICEGKTEEEIIKEWTSKVLVNFEDCYKYNDNWTWKGRIIRIVELPNSFNDNRWKQLIWQ